MPTAGKNCLQSSRLGVVDPVSTSASATFAGLAVALAVLSVFTMIFSTESVASFSATSAEATAIEEFSLWAVACCCGGRLVLRDDDLPGRPADVDPLHRGADDVLGAVAVVE